MRPVDVLLTVLLPAGILCSGSAEHETERSGQQHGHSREASLESYVTGKCKRNGGPTAFDSVKKNVRTWQTCAVKAFSIFDTDPQLLDHRSPNFDVAGFSKMYCDNVRKIEHCEKEFTDSVKNCLDREEKETIDMLRSMEHSVVELVCREDGRMIAEFLKSGGPQCLSSERPDLQVCIIEAFGNYPPSHKRLGRLERPLVINGEDCVNANEMKSCLVGVLKRCENETIADIIESVIDVSLEQTPCDNLIKEWIPSSTEKPKNEPEIDIIAHLIFRVDNPYVSLKHSKQLVKEICLENGGPAAYEAYKEIPETFANGTKWLHAGLVQLSADANASRPNGETDVVVSKYCQSLVSQSGVKTFLKSIVDSVQNCLDERSRVNVNIIYDLMNSGLKFACENGGEHLARFVATGGVECLTAKQEALQRCTADIFNARVPLTDRDIPFVKECAGLKTTKLCFVNAMKECGADETPANLTNDFVDSVLKATPC